MGERQDERSGLLGFLFDEFRTAVADIRSKLVDEGWFGRRAAPPSQFDTDTLGWDQRGHQPFDMPRQSFEEAWAVRDPGEAREIAEPADMDLER